jgi:alpha-tubulin suppressor-like RCC1 family protein
MQVSTGDYHTMCLTQDGEVYAWGGTLHKKLGQRVGRPAIISPLSKKFIIQIGCGDFHSAALSREGELFTWGGGGKDYNRGQLGHGHFNDIEVPTKVAVLNQIKLFACGGYHMMALDE